jgi:hypothetical protein
VVDISEADDESPQRYADAHGAIRATRTATGCICWPGPTASWRGTGPREIDGRTVTQSSTWL